MSLESQSLSYLEKAIVKIEGKKMNGKPVAIDPETHLFIAQVYATLAVAEQLRRRNEGY